MIKAIIFDCFGVLTTEGWLNFKDKYFSHNPELSRQATDLNRQTNLGLMSHDEFVQKIARLAGVGAAEARNVINNNVANEPLLRYIAKLKQNYKIGILSNASANWLDELFKPEDLKLFDEVVLSYEAGIIKPDPKSFKVAAERLGVNVNECIFIDDQERYCAAAKNVGMQAIWYRDFEQMKAELEKLLADSKS